MRRYVIGVLAGALLLLGGIAFAEQQVQSFTDVPDNHWAKQAIEFVQKAKISKGRADGAFAPNEPITRAEAAQMLYNYQSWRERGNRAEYVNRGCTACHKEVPGRGDHRLGATVNKIPDHPQVPADSGVDKCLECHKPGGEAKLMLRTIVHPIHYNSPIFRERYKGSCFNCHDVNVDGKFTVLKEAIEVDQRGVPKTSPYGPDGK